MAVTSLEQVRQTIADYDAAHYECPVDKRQREKEAAAQAQKAREAHEQQNQSNLMAAVEHRIGQ